MFLNSEINEVTNELTVSFEFVFGQKREATENIVTYQPFPFPDRIPVHYRVNPTSVSVVPTFHRTPTTDIPSRDGGTRNTPSCLTKRDELRPFRPVVCIQLAIEWFSNDCRKTSTKVIIPSNYV